MARIEPARVAIAAGIGAALGTIFWLDQLIIGADHLREITDIQPATGFFWLVPGTAALAVAVLFLLKAFEAFGTWLARRDVDPRHANHCMHHWRSMQRRHRCSCRCNATTWSPEERRQALRVVKGGR